MRACTRRTGFACAATLLLIAVLAGCQSREQRAAAHLERADELLAEDRGVEAILELRSAAQLVPDDPDVNLRVADVSLEYGYLGDAADYYREVHYQRPDDAEVALKLARLLMIEEPERASEIVDDVLERDDSRSDAWLVKAEVAIAMAEPRKAMGHVQRARTLAPDNPEVEWARAKVEEAKIHAIRNDRNRRILTPQSFETALAAYDLYQRKGGERRLPALLGRARLLAIWPGHLAQARQEYAGALEVALHEGARHEKMELYRAARAFAESTGDDELAQTALVQWVVLDRSNLAAWEDLAELVARTSGTPGSSVYLKMIAANPQDPAAHVIFARFRAKKSGLATGLEHLRSRLDSGMDPAVLLAGIAELQLAHKRPVDAARTIAELQEKYPDRPSTALLVARKQLRERDPDAAVRTLEELIERDDSSDARMLLAAAELKRHRYAPALAAVDRAIALEHGRSPRALRLRVRILHEQGDQRGALASLKRLQRLQPLSSKDQLLMAQLHYETNGIVLGRRILIDQLEGPRPTSEAAVEFARREARTPSQRARARKYLERAHANDRLDVEVFTELTNLDIEDGRVKEAVKRLHVAVAANPRNADFLLLRARVALSIGHAERAAQDAEQALQLSRTSPDEAIELLTYIYGSSPDLQATIAAIEASAGPQGLGPDRLVILARLYLKAGDEDEALATYERALASGSELSIVKNDLAFLLAKQGRDLERAIALAEQALEKAEESLSAADTLGYVYLKAGQYDAALWQFRYVTSTADPPVAEYYYHMALALLELEQPAKAKTALHRALAIDPEFSEASDARSRLALLAEPAASRPDAS